MTTTKTTERKVDEKAALKALSNISKAVADKRAEKRAAEEAARVAKRDARKANLLAILHTGKPGAKSDIWGIRYALAKAVTATKFGATADDLRACEALQAVAPWGDLRDPVVEYCEAMAADTGKILAGLNALSTPAAAPATPAAEEEEPEEITDEEITPVEEPEPAKPARQRRERKPRGNGKKATQAA